jgi:hypothetical protein
MQANQRAVRAFAVPLAQAARQRLGNRGAKAVGDRGVETRVFAKPLVARLAVAFV